MALLELFDDVLSIEARIGLHASPLYFFRLVTSAVLVADSLVRQSQGSLAFTLIL